MDRHDSPAARLIRSRLGAATDAAIDAVDLDRALASGDGERIDRAGFAAALCVVLHQELLDRVPTGAAFVADERARGERIRFDHGALRTIRFADKGTGALPGGVDAIARILEPLGYAHAGTYPLPRLKMTGQVYAHGGLPRDLPQFFVSELHVEAFDDAGFSAAAHAVFDASTDPLTPAARDVLDRFGREEAVTVEAAVAALPEIVAAFDRQHGEPTLADYETLRTASAEAAWIATEGNAFNHGTAHVADVEASATRERAAGRPIKAAVEVSASGRVRQTAFLADPVERRFRDGDGIVTRSVPGSFYEIISRAVDPATGQPDPRFDSGNATGIFAVTAAR